MSESINSILEWLENEIRNNPFGRVAVAFEVHDGKVVRIEKTITEKLKQ